MLSSAPLGNEGGWADKHVLILLARFGVHRKESRGHCSRGGLCAHPAALTREGRTRPSVRTFCLSTVSARGLISFRAGTCVWSKVIPIGPEILQLLPCKGVGPPSPGGVRALKRTAFREKPGRPTTLSALGVGRLAAGLWETGEPREEASAERLPPR